MSKFVFRNNTIERFFDKDYKFSGYDDISYIPLDADSYLWWYQLPIKFDTELVSNEIDGYTQKLSYVLSKIDRNKMLIALTMDIFYSISYQDDDYRVKSAVNNYNQVLFKLELKYPNLKVIDIADFNMRYSSEELFDWKFYFMSQMGMNPKLHKEFKKWYNRKIESIALKRKKCLVLDLDNTLWGGILGEDGINGIKIGGDYPGKAYLYFQEALLQLAKSGVILTVCSKNNEKDVMDVWEKNPYIILKKDSFAAYRINWNDKATNIKELADELNIGLDSFVFLDDNPSERELVKQALPMVEVPDFPVYPYEFPVFFKSILDNYFKVYSVTDEDRKKTEQYKANAARIQSQNSFADIDKFLESLEINITIEKADDFNIPRIAQMTQKTNQFNLTTKRYTDSDIRDFLSNGWKIWCVSVADKFGDNGITGAVFIDHERIDTLLLSCRILGKGIEFAFLKTILSLIKKSGKSKLYAQYIPTSKNIQVKDFYDRCGFSLIREDNEVRDYQVELENADLSIKNYFNINFK